MKQQIRLRYITILVVLVAALWSKYSPVICWSLSTLIYSLFSHHGNNPNSTSENFSIKVSSYLMEYAWRRWDQEKVSKIIDKSIIDLQINIFTRDGIQGYDLSKPLLFKGIIDVHDSSRNLTIEGMMKAPLSDLLVPYFSDASKKLLTPDREAPIGEIVHNISSRQSNNKIASQIPIDTFPALISELSDPIFTEMFGDRFKPSDVNPFLGFFPALTTVPIFCASHNGNSTDERRSRTDLHSEPIGNVSIQLHGKKKWYDLILLMNSLMNQTLIIP